MRSYLDAVTEPLYVRFVIFKGEILAVFMRSSADKRYFNGKWLRACYAIVGQQGECFDGMEKRERATIEEYTPLLNELKAIGYTNIEVTQ